MRELKWLLSISFALGFVGLCFGGETTVGTGNSRTLYDIIDDAPVTKVFLVLHGSKASELEERTFGDLLREFPDSTRVILFEDDQVFCSLGEVLKSHSREERVVVVPGAMLLNQIRMGGHLSLKRFLSHYPKAVRVLVVTAEIYSGATDRFTLADTEFRLERQKRGKVETTVRHLNAADAAAVWNHVAECSIPKWKRHHSPSDANPSIFVLDGLSWRLALRIGPNEFYADGDNAYPGLSQVGTVVVEKGDIPNAYDKLISILERVGNDKN